MVQLVTPVILDQAGMDQFRTVELDRAKLDRDFIPDDLAGNAGGAEKVFLLAAGEWAKD
jgi:hypothetical protein